MAGNLMHSGGVAAGWPGPMARGGIGAGGGMGTGAGIGGPPTGVPEACSAARLAQIFSHCSQVGPTWTPFLNGFGMTLPDSKHHLLQASGALRSWLHAIETVGKRKKATAKAAIFIGGPR